MTEDEKKQYELARQGIARLMGDASEVDKWSEKVRQTRAGEQRHAAVTGDAPEACPADRHDYYTAFLSYQFCPYCGVRLLPQPSPCG